MFSDATIITDLINANNQFVDSEDNLAPLDLFVENYLALVNQLQKELKGLKEELVHHKKIHGEITNSLDEFFTIQRLSSIITKNLEYNQIVRDLDEIAQKVVSHECSEVFLWEEGKFSPVTSESKEDFALILEKMAEEGILNWLQEQGHPIVIPLRDLLLGEQLDSTGGNIVVAPMMREQELRGVYLLRTDREHSQFSFRDLELLNILTQQAAIAMEYTRLYKKLESAHEALKKSQARLMQTVKMATVGELAGGIAHEINNPLQIILGNVQMAMMGYHTEKSLKIVETQAMRIANIVRGLLSMAKQKSVSNHEYLEINPLIMNTLNLVRSQIEKRGIQIILELQDKLSVVQGSSIYFQQIFLNFLLHAKKQIERDGSITIRSKNVDDFGVQIELEDTGIPMPPQYIRKILDPFEELDNSSEINLGLAVSVQMIRDIGGKVEISSGDKRGNKIIITIPKHSKKEEKDGKDAISTSP
ncbi:MAG: hypothetical protein Kow0042_03410 [Calditrichia bacterium]